MTWIEAVATLFGLTCVWLTIRQNIWCWPTGIVQVALYIYIFYQTRLYADMILHIIYVATSIYGWIHWSARKNESLLAVTLLNNPLLWIIIMIIGNLCWGYGLATYTDASLPYVDSFVVMASLVAQWLMANKKLESWLFWILADVVAVGLYLYKDLYLTTGLYTVFLALAIAGYFSWRKDYRQQKEFALP